MIGRADRETNPGTADHTGGNEWHRSQYQKTQGRQDCEGQTRIEHRM
jgi:hypothetical protein